jgi:putative oxidoreductase
VEEQKIVNRRDQPHLSRFVKLCRVFVRIALGTLFVFAGATKAYDPGAFAIEIQRYQLVPWIPGALAALYLPWLEMLVGALLLLKRLERGAVSLIACLLVVFSLALLSAMFRGLNIDCGCFGKVFAETGTILPLLRNILLLALTGFLWLGYQ